MGLLSYPEPELSDGHVRLRRWNETDADCIREASTDPAITKDTSVPGVFTRDEGLAFIHRQWSRLDDGVGVSQAIVDMRVERTVGLVIVNLRPQAGVGGLGYWVIPSARGAGVAVRAVRLVSEWALSALGLNRIEAWVAPDNASSQRVLISAGYLCEGRLRNFFHSPSGPSDAVVLSRIPDSQPTRP